MIEVSEILQKAKQATVLNIASQIGFDETADILEKGRKAQVGEIRDWKGVKMQKTANGWVPVKQQSKGGAKLPDEGKLIYEPKNADIHNRMEVEKRGDKYVVREVGNNGKKRFLKETDAKGAQEMLKNHTLDMDKNIPPKQKEHLGWESGFRSSEKLKELFSEKRTVAMDMKGYEEGSERYKQLKEKYEKLDKEYEDLRHKEEEEFLRKKGDKNTSSKEKDDRKILESLGDKLEDWGFPIHGSSITRSKTGSRLKITFPVDQKWIEGSDSYENLESKMQSVLDDHKKELDEMGAHYKFDIVPGGRGTLDIACYFRIK